MKFNLIPDWNKKELTCHCCKSTKSVKYETENHMYLCSKCVLLCDESELLKDLLLEQREAM